MTALAPLLEAFFLDRLLKQQQASPMYQKKIDKVGPGVIC